jgi:hypothetical protein
VEGQVMPSFYADELILFTLFAAMLYLAVVR